MYDAINKGISEQSPFRQKLVRYALSVSRERNASLERGKPVGAFLAWQHKMFDRIVFSKLRDRLGGRLK